MPQIELAFSSSGPMSSEDSSTLAEQDEGMDIENRFRKMSKALKLF
jgi:hypothetical protein